tara:strand:+ start:13723 stop:14157 length:435 start_codon:yes stop_codon:yes gene_type:complete
MTRINCVPVETLTDKHLLAEYKEITRPFNKVIKRVEKYGIDKALNNVNIPEQYVLGSGHESFFFNKLNWLHQRYTQLWCELDSRGFNVCRVKFGNISADLSEALVDTPYWGSWKPTPEDMYLNMARLAKRSNLDNVLEELSSRG